MTRSGMKVKVEKDKGKTPATKPAASEYIKLKVQDTDGRTVSRTMRRTDQLQALIGLLYDGRRLRGWQTPAELLMEDGDEVDFFVELLGGAGGGWLPPTSSSMLA